MPNFLLGDATQLYVATLVYPSRTRPADADFTKLPGGTGAELQIGENDITTKEFDTDLWEDGVIAALNWSIPWDGNWRADDTTYGKVEAAALAGTELYIELRPLGTGSGLRRWHGAASVTGFRIAHPADNIITNNFTFRGRGPLLNDPQPTPV